MQDKLQDSLSGIPRNAYHCSKIMNMYRNVAWNRELSRICKFYYILTILTINVLCIQRQIVRQLSVGALTPTYNPPTSQETLEIFYKHA